MISVFALLDLQLHLTDPTLTKHRYPQTPNAAPSTNSSIQI